MANRLSQLPLEVLVQSDVPISARLSQLPLEVLHSPIAAVTAAQLSQLPLEVLVVVSLATAEAQLSQLPLEVLREGIPPMPTDETRVTQLVVEVPRHLASAAHVSQLLLEAPWQQSGAARVTHLLIEVARPRPAPPVFLGTPGLAWIEWRGRVPSALRDDVLETVAYSDWDMQCPPSYYHGFKAARVESFGTATRTLSDPRSGDWQGSACEIRLSDVDRMLRTTLATTPGRFGADAFVTVRMVDRATRAVLGEPLTVFAGPIRRAEPQPPLSFALLLEDAVGHGMLTDQLLIPQRVVDSSRFPGIALASGVTGHPVPIIYGAHAREAGAVAPVYLGIDNASGQHVWLVAGHDAAVTNLFVDGISVLGTVGSDWFVSTEDIDGYRYTLIRGRAGQPPSVTDPVLYAENAGVVGTSYFETWLASYPLGGSGAAVRWDVNSTTAPHGGSKCIEGVDLREGELVRGQFGVSGPPGTAVPRGYALDDYSDLTLWIKNGTASWDADVTLELTFLVGPPLLEAVGVTVAVFHGEYGFDETNVTTYQAITIPLVDFGADPGARADYLLIRKTGTQEISATLDDISLSGGTEAEREVTTADQAAGGAAFTINCTGWEDSGLITNIYQQYQHFLINYVANPAGYQTGPALPNPEIDLFDRVVNVVLEASFGEASDKAEARYPPDGYIGKGVLGATAGERLSVRQWIARWNLSADCRLGISRYGEIFIVLADPTEADYDAARLVDEVNDILEGSLTIAVGWEDQATRVPYRADYNWATGAWLAVGRDAEDTALAAIYGRDIESPVKDYWFVPTSDQGKNVGEHEVQRVGHPPRVLEFETNLDLATAGLGGFLRVRHFAGVGPSEIRLVQIEELTVSPGTRRVRIRGVDVTGLVAPVPEGASAVLGIGVLGVMKLGVGPEEA